MCSTWPRTGSRCWSFTITGWQLAAVDLDVEQRVALGQHHPQPPGVDLERHGVAGLPVDHAGHGPGAAQPAVRARTALLARLQGQDCAVALCHRRRSLALGAKLSLVADDSPRQRGPQIPPGPLGAPGHARRASRARASRAPRRRGLVRSKDARKERMDDVALQSAERLVETLGTMKGAAMKMGQLASFIDTDYLPDEYRELYQEKLGTLRNSAPPMPWEKVRKVLDQACDEPYEELFERIEPEAVAAASIGQVHRGALHDGREVAVKIQYPGIDAAIRADLSNAGMILRLDEGARAGPRRQGGGRRAARARARGARLRARGAEPAQLRARLPRPPVHPRAGRGHPPVARQGARHRVRRAAWASSR